MGQIVCVDTTNIVIWAILQEGKAEDDVKRQQAVYLFQALVEGKDRILIPAIILAELTAKMDATDRQEVVKLISGACEVVPFDAGAALEYGTIRSVGMNKKGRQFPRKEISLDSLIVATCKKYKVQTLYTDDGNLTKIASPFMHVEGLPTIPPFRLSLPFGDAEVTLENTDAGNDDED